MNALLLRTRPVWLLALSTLVPAASGSDYAQWRGPNRDSHSPETGLLQEWPKEGPRLVWQVQNIGYGFSTPSIKGETIYLLSNEGLENEFAMALSTKDGSRRWSTRLGKVGHPEQDPKYPAARSTPTVDGNYLYALGSDGDLVCLDAKSGKERWRKQLRTEFGGKYGEWAYSESPLVDEDRVVCTPGGTNATMIAFDKDSGKVVWSCVMPQGDDAGYGSVVAVNLGGVKQYVQFLSKGLAGLEPKTGKLLWRYERSAKGSPAVILTPLVSDDVVYSGAFRAGAALVRPSLKDGTWTVEELYFNNKLPFGVGGVVKVGDQFYGSGSDTAMCVEFKSGDIRWQERCPAGSWLYADKRLYLHGENGDMLLIEATPEAYREKGRFTPPDRPSDPAQSKAWAHPVITDGKLYVRELNSLWCYDIKAAK